MVIAIIDDQQLISGALKTLLADIFEPVRIDSFNDPDSFLEAYTATTPPDIIFVDIIMPRINGIKLMELSVRKYGNKIKMIALSSLRDIPTIKNALKAGAKGYLSKDVSPEELKEAVLEINNGKQYIEKGLRDRLINNILGNEEIILHLSEREQDVLNGICNGLTIKEIASQLYLSPHTIQYYHKNILSKFKLKKTTELIVFAIQHGLFVPGQGADK